MRIQILAAFLALLLVTGCSKKSDDLAMPDLEISAQDRSPISSLETIEAPGAVDRYGPTPGTQQDLVVNVGDRVFFGFDQHDLNAEARATVERQAQWLKQYPSLSVTVEGHCDERGTREYNLALGERRATAVRNYMIAMGIPASRITTISYGKERPAVMGSNESAWSQNRRGVVTVE